MSIDPFSMMYTYHGGPRQNKWETDWKQNSCWTHQVQNGWIRWARKTNPEGERGGWGRETILFYTFIYLFYSFFIFVTATTVSGVNKEKVLCEYICLCIAVYMPFASMLMQCNLLLKMAAFFSIHKLCFAFNIYSSSFPFASIV